MPEESNNNEPQQTTLSTQAARNLATTTKTPPMMVGITPRWLLMLLPWVHVDSGTYRVNRRKVVLREPGKVLVNVEGDAATVEAGNLSAIPLFQGIDEAIIESITNQFGTELYEADETVVTEGEPGDKFYIIARGKVEASMTGPLGQKLHLRIMGSGDYFGEIALLEDVPRTATVRTLTPCIFLTLQRPQFETLLSQSPEVRASIERVMAERRETEASLVNEYGERKIDIISGHEGEPDIPETFADYEEEPCEYPLSVAQTIIRIHTRVMDIYNGPMNQFREQIRLGIEEIKERQEWEMINNKEFGLLHNVAPSMRVQTRTGPPTPDDMDELLSRVWKKPAFFLAHPKAIAAFGRECTRRGVPPPTVEMFGSPFLTWRGVPIVPSDKLLVNGRSRSSKAAGATNILLMRVGEGDQGVVGLHQTGIPGEFDGMPGVSVRSMGMYVQAIETFLISTYFSVAALVDDALGILENVEVSDYYDYTKIPLK